MHLKNKRKIIKNRVLSVFLSAALVITMLPATVSRAGTEDNLSVAVTDFTEDTTFYNDSTADTPYGFGNAWTLWFRDTRRNTMTKEFFTEADKTRIKEGLDGQTLQLKSIVMKVSVSGTVTTPFTLYANIRMNDRSWSYGLDYENNCSQTKPTVSSPGEYEVVTTIDDSVKDCSTNILDSSTLVLSTVETDSVTTNPNAVVKLESITFNKAVANASDLTALTAKIAEAEQRRDTETDSTVVKRASSSSTGVSKCNCTIGSSVALSDEIRKATQMKNTNTQEEIDAEVQKLTDVMDALVSTRELWATCNTALEHKEAEHSHESWAALLAAVDDALAIADDATAEDVAALKQGVLDAVDALEPYQAGPADFAAALGKKIKNLLGYKEINYTAESWAAYQTALDNAQSAVDNPPADLTQEKADALYAALQEAAGALVLADASAAKAELQQVIDQYQDYQAENYTADTWAAFVDALEHAQDYVASESATISTILDAKEALQKAAENLAELHREEGVYLDYWGSWIKGQKTSSMTGYTADGVSAQVNIGDWWMDITGLDLSGLKKPTLEVEYTANDDKLQISYNTTGSSGWNDDNPVITSNKETSGKYKTALSPDTKYLILTSNDNTLEYSRVKIYDAQAGQTGDAEAAKKELDTAISMAEGYKKEDYTADSWAVLEKALAAARAITDASTVEEINAAKKALEDAITGLVKANAPQPTPGNNNNNNNNNNNSNTNTNPTVTPPAQGTVFTAGTLKYKVTNATTVAVQAPQSKTVKSITIPATVNSNGITYKVTSISANAFMNCKKLKTVTIGKNITSIGKNAFKNAKVLKKITVKSAVLKTVGKNALAGIHKKAVIKVPKAKLKKYQKLFKNKGQKKTVKITK